MKEAALPGIIKQFEYYKSLGDKTFVQCSDEALFWQHNEDSNSIAIIVNHLWGNMLSRWTDFLNSDGEKEWRKRDKEFESVIQNRDELLNKWEEGWNCLFNAIRPLKEEDLDRTVYIRNQGHTVLEAIFRQLAHYAYHVGQIVYTGKMLSTEPWNSLSIPKGQSGAFNADKFAQEKKKAHFTDEFLGDSEKK
ncbi:DUF1572 domain-containing protein [bacterium]|nr:DUF1572 domain-containing protein [bacterium]